MANPTEQELIVAIMSKWDVDPHEEDRYRKRVSQGQEKKRWQKQLYEFMTETEPLPCEAGRYQQYTNESYKHKDKDVLEATDPQTRSWERILREIIVKNDEDDLHPYGRGKTFDNIMFGRNVKVNYDANKVMLWVILVSAVALGAGLIIFLSELSIKNRKYYYNVTEPDYLDMETTTAMME